MCVPIRGNDDGAVNCLCIEGQRHAHTCICTHSHSHMRACAHTRMRTHTDATLGHIPALVQGATAVQRSVWMPVNAKMAASFFAANKTEKDVQRWFAVLVQQCTCAWRSLRQPMCLLAMLVVGTMVAYAPAQMDINTLLATMAIHQGMYHHPEVAPACFVRGVRPRPYHLADQPARLVHGCLIR